MKARGFLCVCVCACACMCVSVHVRVCARVFTSVLRFVCLCHFLFVFRANWSTDSLNKAIAAVRDDDMGLRGDAKLHGIRVTTLKDCLDGKNKYAREGVKHFGRPPILPQHLEDELAKHILDRETMLFGLTRKSLMDLAYEVADRNGLAHTFNSEKKSAGKKWLKLFLQRHPEISLRVAEAKSLTCASGFNKQSINRFSDLLKGEIDNGCTGLTIYTTVVCCCNAAGQFVPPMILFERKRMKPELRDGAPVGSLITNNESACW